MTKLEDFIFKKYPNLGGDLDDAIDACKEYAEYYVKLMLEKIADEVIVDYNFTEPFTGEEPIDVEVYAIRSSITNIELPPHD